MDQLFQDAPSEGATLLVARTSRYLVDLNRGENDFDGEAVEGGGRGPWARGLIWRLSTDGEPVLAERLSHRELTRRLDLVDRPYHRTLQALLARKVERFGVAVLLAPTSCPRSRCGPGKWGPTGPISCRGRAAGRAPPGW